MGSFCSDTSTLTLLVEFVGIDSEGIIHWFALTVALLWTGTLITRGEGKLSTCLEFAQCVSP